MRPERERGEVWGEQGEGVERGRREKGEREEGEGGKGEGRRGRGRREKWEKEEASRGNHHTYLCFVRLDTQCFTQTSHAWSDSCSRLWLRGNGCSRPG